MLFAESEGELQQLLLGFQSYCSIWKQRVNHDKSKIDQQGELTLLSMVI